jgi:hypothetical protein
MTAVQKAMKVSKSLVDPAAIERAAGSAYRAAEPFAGATV